MMTAVPGSGVTGCDGGDKVVVVVVVVVVVFIVVVSPCLEVSPSVN